jgi:hypothetical protein
VPAAVAFCNTSHAEELRVTADGASVCWLGPETALLCLRSGQLLQLGLPPSAAGGGARKVVVARAGAAPPPSCCVSLAGPHRRRAVATAGAAAALPKNEVIARQLLRMVVESHHSV